MSKPDSEYNKLAQQAAHRIKKQLQMEEGLQMVLLPDELPEDVPAGAVQVDAAQHVGRPKGAKNKINSQLRDWLAAKGCRMPEDIIAEVAGLRTDQDAITLAQVRAERILAWAFDVNAMDMPAKTAKAATPDQRLRAFEGQYATILRAADAILPYTTPKAGGGDDSKPAVTIVMPAVGQPADPATGARDVTPDAPQKRHRMIPADVKYKMQQEQRLTEDENCKSDGPTRTDEVSD